jgi:hypothetical protein
MSGHVHPVENEEMDEIVPPIEFLTDGRIYKPPGGEFIVVFGTMVTGPTAPSLEIW